MEQAKEADEDIDDGDDIEDDGTGGLLVVKPCDNCAKEKGGSARRRNREKKVQSHN